jgi:type IV pilus assembly protein PilW
LQPLTRQHKARIIRKRNGGFSLIEIMVGMVIALLGTIVMMNVFSVFEAQKRTTTGGSDLQNNGAIALFSMQRTIEQAGYGISKNVDMFGCNLGYTTTGGAAVSVPIAPVTINPPTSLVPAGDGNTDTLLLMYARGAEQPSGDEIISHPSGQDPVTDVTVNSIGMWHPGDQVIVMPLARPSPSCNLTLTTIQSIVTGSSTVTTADGIAAAIFPNVAKTATTGSGWLYNMGNNGFNFVVQAYAIRNGNLTMCDYTANNCGDGTQTNNSAYWLPIGNDIVSMRAEYGRDDPTVDQTQYGSPAMKGLVNTYDQTTPVSTSTTFACDWGRISAIRLVLVGRNDQPNPKPVTTSAPTWTDSSAVPIDLSGTNPMLPTNFTWQNYRYKTFETTIALRNIAMRGIYTGC